MVVDTNHSCHSANWSLSLFRQHASGTLYLHAILDSLDRYDAHGSHCDSPTPEAELYSGKQGAGGTE